MTLTGALHPHTCISQAQFFVPGTRNGGVEPTDQGGRMKLTGRASCLLTHRSWIPVQQEASYQQKSCCPADLF
ncbi:hypothetical protein CapIbe_016906 [Capra ibex]